MTAATCDGASNMMRCKTGLVTCFQECYPEVEEKSRVIQMYGGRKRQ